MLTETLIATTARDGRAILDAVRSDPDAPVESCPGWNTTRLLGHVGHVHRFVTGVVTSRRTKAPERREVHAPPADAEPWEWYEEGFDALLTALRAVDPTVPMWSWTDRRNAGFYQRRMAHENSVHRYDAEAATGTPAHIDAELAADGVAEILTGAMRYRGDGSSIDYPDSSALLVRSDGADRWLIRAMDGTLVIAHNGDAGNRADVTITGPAEDLYLYLWGRRARVLNITGDADAAAAWSAVAP